MLLSRKSTQTLPTPLWLRHVISDTLPLPYFRSPTRLHVIPSGSFPNFDIEGRSIQAVLHLQLVVTDIRSHLRPRFDLCFHIQSCNLIFDSINSNSFIIIRVINTRLLIHFQFWPVLHRVSFVGQCQQKHTLCLWSNVKRSGNLIQERLPLPIFLSFLI